MRVKNHILEIARSKTKSVFLLTSNRIVPYGAGTIKWYFNIMLVILTFLSGNEIALIVVVLIVSTFVVFALRSKKKKMVEEEPEKESLPPGLGDYANDRWENNLYQSSMNPKIKIREVRCFKDRTEDKDKLIFASSLPFDFNSEDKRALIKLIPELIDASVLNSHELLLFKSPAANFNDYHLRESILSYLFSCLNSKYIWMKEKIIIPLQYIEDDMLHCHLGQVTNDHARLGILLGNLPGIANRLKIFEQMEEKQRYRFNIQKKEDVSWDDLLPKIKKVFEEYFTGGVEFVGPN